MNGHQQRDKIGKFTKKRSHERYKNISMSMKTYHEEVDRPVRPIKDVTQANEASFIQPAISDSCAIGMPARPFPVQGRRIVDIELLASSLQKGCIVCKENLDLSKIDHEERRGLGSLWYIDCVCGAINQIKTSKQHFDRTKQKLMPIFDINTKVAACEYHFILFWISLQYKF